MLATGRGVPRDHDPTPCVTRCFTRRPRLYRPVARERLFRRLDDRRATGRLGHRSPGRGDAGGGYLARRI